MHIRRRDRDRRPARPAPFRDPEPIILIVCEGERTEPDYFARLLPILAPRVPLRSSITRSRCDSLTIPALASASGPSGGLMPPGLAH